MALRLSICLLGLALSLAPVSARGDSGVADELAGGEIWVREHPRYVEALRTGNELRTYLAVALSAQDLHVLERAFRHLMKSDGSRGPFSLELLVAGRVSFDPSDRFLERFADLKCQVGKGSQHRAGLLLSAEFLKWTKDQGTEMALSSGKERSTAAQRTWRFPGERKPWELAEGEELRVFSLGPCAFSPSPPRGREPADSQVLWCRPYALKSPTPEAASLPKTFAVITLSGRDLDLLEQVFRHTAESRRDGPFFLEISAGWMWFAPSDCFLRRFPDLRTKLTNAHRQEALGVSLAIDSLKWIDDRQADVCFSYRSGDKAGEGYCARYERKDGRWQLKKGSEKLQWKS